MFLAHSTLYRKGYNPVFGKHPEFVEFTLDWFHTQKLKTFWSEQKFIKKYQLNFYKMSQIPFRLFKMTQKKINDEKSME